MHAWGGGIERHVRDLTELLAPECEVLLLRPVRDSEDCLSLAWANPGERLTVFFGEQDYFSLVSLLDSLCIERVHFHHIHGFPRRVLGLPEALRVSFDCTLHDYFPLCPQYQLITADGHYCGETGEDACRACLVARPSAWDMDIVAWRRDFSGFLRAADRVIVPSRDVASRLRRYFPFVDCLVWPHPESEVITSANFNRVPPASLVKVLLLGGISPAKGLHVLRACALDAKRRSLPLHFCVLGHVADPLPLCPELPISIRGEYTENEIRTLIDLERPSVFFFPSQVPETYCYTLSRAIETGLPIVASDFGAFPERLARYRDVRLLSWNASPADWNDALQAANMSAQTRARAQVRDLG